MLPSYHVILLASCNSGNKHIPALLPILLDQFHQYIPEVTGGFSQISQDLGVGLAANHMLLFSHVARLSMSFYKAAAIENVLCTVGKQVKNQAAGAYGFAHIPLGKPVPLTAGIGQVD